MIDPELGNAVFLSCLVIVFLSCSVTLIFCHFRDKSLNAKKELKRIELESSPDYIEKKERERQEIERKLNSSISEAEFFAIHEWEYSLIDRIGVCCDREVEPIFCKNTDCVGSIRRYINVTRRLSGKSLYLYKDSSIESILYPNKEYSVSRDIINKLEKKSSVFIEYSDNEYVMEQRMKKYNKKHKKGFGYYQ